MNGTMFSALAVAVLFAAFAMAGTDDYAEEERKLMRYCERVVDYHADKAMGVPIEQRRGNRDHKGIAESDCPGMKPAR
ncbi:MAG: hypothetical protein ACQEW0_16330 [Pseudomonadota bacterium]